MHTENEYFYGCLWCFMCLFYGLLWMLMYVCFLWISMGCSGWLGLALGRPSLGPAWAQPRPSLSPAQPSLSPAHLQTCADKLQTNAKFHNNLPQSAKLYNNLLDSTKYANKCNTIIPRNSQPGCENACRRSGVSASTRLCLARSRRQRMTTIVKHMHCT